MKTEDLIEELRAQVKALVKKDRDVRAEVSRLVENTSSQFLHAKDGLTGLVKAVVDGAMEGADATLDSPDNHTLKEVVDGITDGLEKSAQAVRLTIEEAAASGTRFATDDLHKISEDFRVVGEVLVNVITAAVETASGHLQSQARSLAEHAQHTLQTLRPSLDMALRTATDEPTKLGSQALDVGSNVARRAAGVLFNELGRYLQQMGGKLQGSPADPHS